MRHHIICLHGVFLHLLHRLHVLTQWENQGSPEGMLWNADVIILTCRYVTQINRIQQLKMKQSNKIDLMVE